MCQGLPKAQTGHGVPETTALQTDLGSARFCSFSCSGMAGKVPHAAQGASVSSPVSRAQGGVTHSGDQGRCPVCTPQFPAPWLPRGLHPRLCKLTLQGACPSPCLPGPPRCGA